MIVFTYIDRKMTLIFYHGVAARRCSASCIDAKYFLQRVSGITKFKLMCKRVAIARL